MLAAAQGAFAAPSGSEQLPGALALYQQKFAWRYGASERWNQAPHKKLGKSNGEKKNYEQTN